MPANVFGRAVNLLAYAFGGSNPPLSTTSPAGTSPGAEKRLDGTAREDTLLNDEAESLAIIAGYPQGEKV